MEDYLGDINKAFSRLEKHSPKKCECIINNSDKNSCRYGVKLWNLFGEWYASEETLAGSINKVLDNAIKENFKLSE